MLRILLVTLLQPLRTLLFIYFRLASLHRPFTLRLSLRGDYSEAPLTHGIWALVKPGRNRFYLLCLELQSIINAAIARRIKLRHIALTIESHNLGWAQAWELRQLLQQATRAKIRTSCWLLDDNRISLYIATGCEFIYATDGVVFDLSSFTSESLFMLSLLNKLGVRPQFLSVGSFKSAAEIFTRNSMSRAARKQTEELIANIEAEFFSALASRSTKIKNSRFSLLSANGAQKLGLINGLASAEEYETWIKGEKPLPLRDLHRTLKLLRKRTFRFSAFRRARRIALIVAEGPIIDSDRPRPETINWHDYASLGDELSEQRYDAVLIRVNSPGGSAQVSQLLWREWMLATRRLEARQLNTVKKRKKGKGRRRNLGAAQQKALPPVFVSQGNVAASGGYYLSAAGEKIFTTPLSITGSIGVVGGKFNVAPLLAKWGINVDRAPKNNAAPLFSAFADFDREQRQALAANMQEIYEQFLHDVAMGRNRATDKLRPHAAGRVFSGKRALQNGLADEMGGLCDALSALRQKLGLPPLAPLEIVVLPTVQESLFNRAGIPTGLGRIAVLADFAVPGIYTLDPRWAMLV